MSLTDASNAVSQGECRLVVVWLFGKQPIARRVKIGASVLRKLQEFAQQSLTGLTREMEYQPDADIEEYSHMRVDRDESFDQDLLKILSTKKFPFATDSELRSKTLLCHALVFSLGAEPQREYVFFIRKQSTIQIARKSFTAKLDNGRLDEISHPIFAFDEKFDIIADSDNLYILNKKVFESLFKNSDVFLATIPAAVKAAIPVDLVSGQSLETLSEVLRQNSILRNKFWALYKRGVISKINTATLYDGIVSLKLNAANYIDSTGRLVINQNNVHDVIRLLNEDMFTGTFSGDNFSAGSKRLL